MRRLPERSLGVFLLGLAVIPLLGQDPKPVSLGAHSRVEIYYVEIKTVNVQALADGTTITKETREVEARDSQGRSVHLTVAPAESGGEFTFGRIENPLESTDTTWDSQRKKATVMRLPAPDQRVGCWQSNSGRETISYGTRPAPVSAPEKAATVAIGQSVPVAATGQVSKQEPQHEDLGTTTIQGIEAKGERWTTMIPAGDVGNDKPIATVTEVWQSATFPMPLREINIDPRMGKKTREVVSLTIGEPDPSLFQPPEGYEILTEEMHEIPCQD